MTSEAIFHEPPYLTRPVTGRYLSPEPLLQSPEYVRTMAQSGLSVPAYAYAANNPLRYSDADGLRIRLMDPEAASAGFGMRLTPEGRALYEWLDASPYTYDIYGNAANFPDQLPPDTYGRYLPGETDNGRCNLGGGSVLVDARKARGVHLTPARVLAHELTHAGLHDQQLRRLPFVPDSIYRYMPDSRPGGGLPGSQTSNGPHRAMDFYWIFSFGGP